MCVLWRYRLVMSVLSVLLFFLGCDSHLHNEAQSGKLVYAHGNHWAVGHLMGKKSIDEMLGSDDHDVDSQAYLITAESDTQSQPARLLKTFVKLLTGPEKETEERERRSMELRRQWEDQQARKSEAARFLLLALNTRDADAS